MTKKQPMQKNNSGFTLTELLMVISITLILAVSSIPIYSNLQASAQINETSSQIVQNLRLARERSLSRYKGSGHGVYFDIDLAGQDRYIIYKGTSYASRDTDYDMEFLLDEGLEMTNSTLTPSGGDIDINFSQGLGIPSNTGDLKITSITSENNFISINEIGMIELN